MASIWLRMITVSWYLIILSCGHMIVISTVYLAIHHVIMTMIRTTFGWNIKYQGEFCHLFCYFQSLIQFSTVLITSKGFFQCFIIFLSQDCGSWLKDREENKRKKVGRLSYFFLEEESIIWVSCHNKWCHVYLT